MIQARRGSIHWLADEAHQDGVVVASTSLSHPGSLVFDPLRLPLQSRVTFGTGSVTTVLPEKDGETTSSSVDADKSFVTSSVKVNANAVMESGALIEVPAGNVTFALDAYMASGATVDVSGLANVTLPMSALLVIIPRIGLNELADSPLLRNSPLYTAKNVAIDSTQSGTRPDGVQWVGSPILNAAGYVTAMPRTVDQLMIKGGTIAFRQNAIIRTGAQLRAEGGFLNYLPGYIQTPRLQGANGLLYRIEEADPNVAYTGFAGVYSDVHSRWGVTNTYTNPLLANTGRFDPGFIKGGDAGSFSFGQDGVNGVAYNYIIDGDLSAHAYAGREQVRTGLLPSAGSLSIDVQDLAALTANSPIYSANAINYVIQRDRVTLESYAPSFDENSTLPVRGGDPNDPKNPSFWRTLSTAMIDNSGIRKLRLVTPGTVLVDGDANLRVADGGEVDITAVGIDVKGSITSHAGTINLVSRPQGAVGPDLVDAFIRLGSSGRLDTSGRWVNDTGRAADYLQGSAWINGGSVSLVSWQGVPLTGDQEDTTADILLDKGSVVDVSGGGYVGRDGKLLMDGLAPKGRGGDVSIQTHVASGLYDYFQIAQPKNLTGGNIRLDGTLLANGFSGGGKLTLHAPMIQVGGTPTVNPDFNLLYLDPAFFASQGFASYSLIADTDAFIAPGAQVVVRQKNMVANQYLLAVLPSTTHLLGESGLAAGVTTGEVDAYQRHAESQKNDGISIQAGGYRGWSVPSVARRYKGVSGTVDIGEGARLEVDAGNTISLTGTGHVVVDGSLSAKGGTIGLNNVFLLSTGLGLYTYTDANLWLGDSAILDVSGTSLIDPAAPVLAKDGLDARRQRTGVVLAGGSVNLVAENDLVAERGARILINGASDSFETPVVGRLAGLETIDYQATPVWSDAGSLNIGVSNGLYFDASVDAHGGAAAAGGGKLGLAVRTPSTGGAPGSAQIVFVQDGWRVGEGLDPYSVGVLDKGDGGDIRFVADRLKGTGISDLFIGKSSDGSIGQIRPADVAFAGDVDLALPRSVQIYANNIASMGANDRKAVFGVQGTHGGQVNISAPYLSILGNTNLSLVAGGSSGDGSLAVQADFIDIGGNVNLSGFGKAAFGSTGDLRFWAPSDQLVSLRTGWLFSTGDLDFTATRVYPTSAYRFLIDASNPTKDTTVTFHNAAVTDTSTPLSAGGTLAVAADHIVQEGTLWVPSGALALGTDDPAATLAALGLSASMPLDKAKDVHLAPGSVTSVSLKGAVVPYGTTVDGKDWHYDSVANSATNIIDKPPEKSVSIAGDTVAIDAGATVDLSGGGYVQAVEWIPGTGGSRDVLAQTNTSFSNSQAGIAAPLYADNRPIYAIVPGYDAPLSAHDAALEKGTGAGPAVGQGVYLKGVPGLPDGVYTLLPARYATLPGAFRVVQDTGISDAVLGRVTTAPDGTYVAGGYFTDTLTGARNARVSSFMVQSAKTWGQYSEYSVTSADTFFSNLATKNSAVVPRLGADAGRLTLAATSGLSLGATLVAKPGAGGRGSQVDIAGEAIQVVGCQRTGAAGLPAYRGGRTDPVGRRQPAYRWQAESTAKGDVVDVIADRVLLSNDAAHPLQGSEIILVAGGNGGVTIGDGSVLRATATSDTSAVPLLIGQVAATGKPGIRGDGALLRVSGSSAGSILRSDITGIDGPAGTPGGDLVIGKGTTIEAAGSLSMDATGRTMLSPDASLKAKSVDVTAGRIGLNGVDIDGQGTAGSLQIGPRILAQLAASDAITLRGRTGIDLIGDVALAVASDLFLSAPTITSDGGHASLSAGSLTVGNDTGAVSSATAPGKGSLDVSTKAFHLGSGNVAVAGLGSLHVAASSGAFASGTGSLDLGAADTFIEAPSLRADKGADNRVVTTGAMRLGRIGTAAATTRTAGGAIDLEAGSIDVGTDIVTPGGKVVLHAASGNLAVDNGATIDVGGLSQPFNDTVVHIPGGSVQMKADRGDITLASGSTVDLRGASDGGNAGNLSITAAAGKAAITGQLLGSAAENYLGGLLTVDTFGALDLGDLAARAAAGGLDGSVNIHTRSGDLTLGAGQDLRAHLVYLTADGGSVGVAGTVDASGTFGGTISIFGAKGVDVDGRLDTSASVKGHRGGDITLGTSGVGRGALDPTYGYESIAASDAGHIRLGQSAKIVQDGDIGDGKLYLRAPLLVGGDVPVDIANGIDLTHTSSTTLEAYAVWDTKDDPSNLSRHFDGVIDPAGWFKTDPVTGRVVMVDGHFTDDAGQAVADPDWSDDKQVADYLSRYRFTPTAPNLDHATFYGYQGGDATQGAGTLMGFVQQPGFTFESRLAAVPGLHVRPGIELRNGGTTLGGDIAIVSNWNLGAGTRDEQGNIHQLFRYGPAAEAPVLSLRASHDLDVRASITDAFFQTSNAGGSVGVPPTPTSWAEASAAWEALKLVVDTATYPDLFSAPTEFTSGDPNAISDYYQEYKAYADYLQADLPEYPGFHAADAMYYGLGLGLVDTTVTAPPAPTTPVNINQYVPYLAKYPKYLNDSLALTGFLNTLSVPDGFVGLIAPPTTLDAIDRSAPVDNSPSPIATASNPLPILSATLVGGNSSSYRLVAGADTLSVDPSALLAAVKGDVRLSGHTDFTDSQTDRVVVAPTVIRTGTGDIDIAASGDIRWLDDRAPTAIYTAGAPADGTTADTSAKLLRTSQIASGSAIEELVITGAVNPEHGGDISLKAGGSIVGQQNTQDTTGDLTGTAGTLTGQYWWQWMQTGNTEDRSSIVFGAFDQGVMSVGGNVKVDAGGDIRQLSVSLPTTWSIATAGDGTRSLRTYGGGDLAVRAGGDILSGSYFVAKGQGSIHADGSIGADFSTTYTKPTSDQGTMPVSTLIAMQDAQVGIDADGSVALGGIFNPSWLDHSGLNTLLPAGHADGQSYSTNSRIDVTAYSGDLTYGDLVSPTDLFSPGIGAQGSLQPTAGDILPATVNFVAASGDLYLKNSGELFPSSQGNLGLLANGSIHFAVPPLGRISSRYVWGMIDAPLSSMASPLNLAPLTANDQSPAAKVRQFGYLGTALSGGVADLQYVHAATPWHAADSDPVRIYALNGDILDGTGGGMGAAYVMPSKVARIEAGRDIVDLAYVGQQVHAADTSVIRAGRDIIDTPLSASALRGGGVDDPWSILPVIVQGGSGYLWVQAGRDLGRLASQTEYQGLSSPTSAYKVLPLPGQLAFLSGVNTVGNAFNPYLSQEGASIYTLFGTARGMATSAFIKAYVDPSASKPAGLDDASASLVSFVQDYDAGLGVDTGLTVDNVAVHYTVDQAWSRFKSLPEEAQAIFIQKTLYRILAQVGKDYNDDTSAFKGQYARGYAAIQTLFPATLGYTDNGRSGSNGADQRVVTGNLDLRGSTIQTQRGGDVSILGPGGDVLLGSTSAPPPTVVNGVLVDGPNTQGVLTLRNGDVSIFTDGSTLLAQSRIFTEQGGNVTVWSSNGDVNAGKGAKTTSEIPPVTYICSIDAWCFQNPAGQVSGAGIATLQTIPGAPEGSVYLMAPRGTVDLGDAGVRVSGNLVVAAAHVANADNAQVKGEAIGLPVVQAVNVGALNAASAAASAATKAAEDVVRQQQSDSRDRMPSIISVQVIGADSGASVTPSAPRGYDLNSPSRWFAVARTATTVLQKKSEAGCNRVYQGHGCPTVIDR